MASWVGRGAGAGNVTGLLSVLTYVCTVDRSSSCLLPQRLVFVDYTLRHRCKAGAIPTHQEHIPSVPV